MEKDRLDRLCELVTGELLEEKDQFKIDFLKNTLGFIYAIFPEQKESAIEKNLG